MRTPINSPTSSLLREVPAGAPGTAGNGAAARGVTGRRGNARRGTAVPATEGTYLWVEAGTIAIFRIMSEGRSICTGLLGPGQTMRVRDVGSLRIEALTDSVVVAYDETDVSLLAASSPAMALEMIRSLANQADHLDSVLRWVVGRDISLRIAGVLVALAGHCGRDLGNGMTEITISLPHKSVARMIGGNRVTVTRVVADMRDAGYVASPRRNRVQVNVGMLMELLNSHL